METNNFKGTVVIWGADNYNTLGMLRSLAVDKDFDLIFLMQGSKHNVTSASRYCHKCIHTRSINESVKYLIDNFSIQTEDKKKPILMPGGDTFSLGIANNYDNLINRFHLMCTSNPETLIKVTDKNEMGRVAEDAGLFVPKSQKYQKGLKDIKVEFPVILKPVFSVGRKEFKTKVLNSIEDLYALDKMLHPDNVYLMQQYIPKSHDIVVYGVRLRDGTIRLAGHHTLERWSDDGGGSYGHLSPEIPDYLNPEALKRFFELIDYYGEFSAEYGYVDGKAYFYEANLRNDGFCHLSFQAGANLPLLWVQSCLGLPLTASDKMTRPMIGINEIYDVANVLHGNISWKKYKIDLAEAEAFHFYDPNDQQPYKNMHKRMWWEIPMRAALKKYRPRIVWILNKLKR